MGRLLLLFILFSVVLESFSQSRKGVDVSTDIAMFAPAAVGAGCALLKKDNKGLLQLGESLALQVAVSYALKYTIDKERPDGSDNHSFPSNHTGFAFAGATFLQQRYGWRLGLPAYLVGGYVAWGRIYSKRHEVWDVLAGAAVGAGSALLLTTPFATRNELVVVPLAIDGGCGVHVSMSF